MVGIKYIGTRETHTDNLYGTNLVWKPGQVHNVDDSVAARLLHHADVYAEAKPVKGEAAAVMPMEPEKLPTPLPNLEGMNKTELRTFAQQHYGENLHHAMSEANMRDAILALVQARGRKGL